MKHKFALSKWFGFYKFILDDSGAGNRGALFVVPQSFRGLQWLPDLFV
jgi:hypothetical protein